MNHSRVYSDEELTAYLDGEADYARISEINQALTQDSELRRRLESLSVSRDTISDAFDALLTVAPVDDIRPQVTPEKSRFIFTARLPSASLPTMVASLLVTFLLGWGGHVYWANSQHNDWHAYVAAYQALYTSSTLNHIHQKSDVLSKELQRVSSALGKDLELSTIQRHIPIEYKRSQILGYQGKPLVQLAFLSSMDTPIALCIMRHESLETTAIELSTLENMSAASWKKEGFTYLLIGGNDTLLIRDLADQFAQHL